MLDILSVLWYGIGLRILVFVILTLITYAVIGRISNLTGRLAWHNAIYSLSNLLMYVPMVAFIGYYVFAIFTQRALIKAIVLIIIVLWIFSYFEDIINTTKSKNKTTSEPNSSKQKLFIFLTLAAVTLVYFSVFYIVDVKTSAALNIKMQEIEEQVEEYRSNIETSDENNVVTSSEQRTLTYFCNIPVQYISGSISGTHSLLYENIEGSITTTDILPYWYLDGEDGLYDTAPAESSIMRECPEGETPYIEITSYCNRKKTVNGNTGEVSYEVNYSWTEYVFYLPKELVGSQFTE